MPRLACLDAPGVLHHIMIRGIERRKIFLSRRDYEDFLDRLAILLPETKTACYAWALLQNHAHFLFRTGTVPLARLMRRLLTGYAVSFNLRHKRHGHLFQNRYKSVICQEDAYIRELVRYIHLNPVRARIVADVDDLRAYAYSGHSALMGRRKRQWQDVDYVLGYFGKSVRKARNVYEAYVCYWAVREAGISLRTLAGRLGISGPGVGYAVERGAALVRENNYELMK